MKEKLKDAVYGLAVIMYGYNNIPKYWIEKLQRKDLIEKCLF